MAISMELSLAVKTLPVSPLMLDGFGREINDSPFGDSTDFQGRNGAIGRRIIEGIYVENEAIV